MSDSRVPRNGRTTREAAEITGLSTRSIRRWTSMPRNQYIREQERRREEIRAYHDDQGHTWPETAKHYGTTESNVKQLAYRARRKNAREAEEAAKGPTLFDYERIT
ncbi:hypothetical protein [Cutibacterium modestum]|uniref:hypothetical protein n=2 Tax=Cutibacterium modestum TaxID=2559073 RepID=UPI0020A415B1|nr:hypothetical protein [Cutibacterium modestum]